MTTSTRPDPDRPSAVAVSYDTGDSAPRVVAKGYGTLAETIIRTAREHNLYVHESPELVGLLMQVDLDAHIPPQLYVAIAELLAWLYALDAEGGAHKLDTPRPPPGEPVNTPGGA
ncbi:EscU/YscU/HrcU family type III secretion system export apparatus switch protein [Castellaniella sp. GW247-6E4]|uniref:EscU/YscU/HrcU family type III secretion system export apparatus switch protein n=1 Tax=Castellaniella sp. GW247-6E4 TaxID=3140380 RepID=UPI003314E149